MVSLTTSKNKISVWGEERGREKKGKEVGEGGGNAGSISSSETPTSSHTLMKGRVCPATRFGVDSSSLFASSFRLGSYGKQ